MNGVDTVLRFVDAVNNKDLDALVSLMTPDHRFIDPGGMEVIGRDEMRDIWIGYFRMVPDYRIEVRETFFSEDAVVLLGTASGTFTKDGTLKSQNYWETPAAWRAVVRQGQLAEWQVFADNEPIRKIMRRHGIEPD